MSQSQLPQDRCVAVAVGFTLGLEGSVAKVIEEQNLAGYRIVSVVNTSSRLLLFFTKG